MRLNDTNDLVAKLSSSSLPTAPLPDGVTARMFRHKSRYPSRGGAVGEVNSGSFVQTPYKNPR